MERFIILLYCILVIMLLVSYSVLSYIMMHVIAKKAHKIGEKMSDEYNKIEKAHNVKQQIIKQEGIVQAYINMHTDIKKMPKGYDFEEYIKNMIDFNCTILRKLKNEEWYND